MILQPLTSGRPRPDVNSVQIQPSAAYSITLRVSIPQRPGSFTEVAGAIGSAGALLGGIDLVRVENGHQVRDISFQCADAKHGEAVVQAVRSLENVQVENVS